MVQQESRLKVADNTGAKELLCIRVMVKDISLGGCRLHARSLTVEVGDTIKLTAQISVSGIERIVSLDAEVRSLQSDEDGSVVGVQFASMSDSDRITLHAYVLSNIHAY